MRLLSRKSFETDFEFRVFNKVALRLLPYLIVVLAIAFIDRLNVGFAKLQMAADIGLSDFSYGLGAGIFFIGYCIFEIPSNLIAQRIGTRRWLSIIMVIWGSLTVAMMHIQNQNHFYTLRFFLGVAEAGCYPAAMLYITYWFPPRLRSQVSALFFLGLTSAGFIGGPLSGTIMSHFGGLHGLTGWQWLFIVEGIPAILLGIVTFFFLTDAPLKAHWLRENERNLVHNQVQASKNAATHASGGAIRAAFRNLTIWKLCLANVGILGASSVVGFWLPHVVKSNGVNDLTQVGFLCAIPYIFSGICMIAAARHSDSTGERRWHALAALGLSLSGNLTFFFIGNSVAGAIFAMTCVVIGTQVGAAMIWTVPGSIISGRAVGVAISMVTMGGNLGSYFLPLWIGSAKSWTHHIEYGFAGVAAVQIVGWICLYRIPLAHFNKTALKSANHDVSSIDAKAG